MEADEAFPDNQDALHKISTFFEEACSSFCEGIMVKTLDCNAGYFASKRSEAWLKVQIRYYMLGIIEEQCYTYTPKWVNDIHPTHPRVGIFSLVTSV